MRRSTTRHLTSEPLSHFVDEYLAHLYETCPTEAAADGVHLHDDLLEDLSRSALEARIRDLGGWGRRLGGIDPSGLTREEALEQRMLADRIRSRLFALEQTRDWERNPLFYADTLAGSLTSQVIFPYADIEERARRIGSKLRQTPRLLEAARQNVTEAPGLFVRVGIESFEGVLAFIERDLPRALRDLEDMHLLGDLADASTDAIDALRTYIGHLRDTVAPRSRASFRLGPGALPREAAPRRGAGPAGGASGADRAAGAPGDAGGVPAGGGREGGRSGGRVAEDQGPASGRRRADPDRRGTGARPPRLPPPQADRHPPGPRGRRGGTDPRLLPLDLREPVDRRAVRDDPHAGPLLRHERRSVVAGRAAGRAPPRLQLRDALVDVDARGVSGSLPAVRAPARRVVVPAEVGAVRAHLVRRGMGPTTPSR